MAPPMDRKDKSGFFIGIAVMILIAIIGFQLYKVFTGEGTVSQTFVFIFLALAAFGLVRVGIFAGARVLNMENFILILFLVGGPLAILFMLPKVGINLFSLIDVSGGVSFDFNVSGDIINWIKGNAVIVLIISLLLFWKRRNIAKFLRGR